MAAFEATADSQVGLVTDRGELERLAAGAGPLTPSECMRRAERAAMASDLAALDRTSAADAVLLWRSDASEAWLNLWWQPRDTGFHDHDGSCVGVYVIEGTARNEGLMIGAPRRVHEYGRAIALRFLETGSTAWSTKPAPSRSMYSPPIRSIGEYELEDGGLRRWPVAPDEPSAASPRLLAAVKATGTSRHSESRTLP